MRKTFVCILLVCTVFLSAQEVVTSLEVGNISVSTPSAKETQNYIGFTNFLSQLESGSESIDASKMSRLFQLYHNNDGILGLLFDSYLLYTKNKNIQDLILKTMESSYSEDVFYPILSNLYSAKKVEKAGSNPAVVYECKNGLRDEGINYFFSSESVTFNDAFGFMLLDNPWNQFSFQSDKVRDEDGFCLLYGGGTNSIKIDIKRYNLDEDAFYSRITGKANSFYLGKYRNWKLSEFSITGELSRSGAERVFIGLGTGLDIIETISSGTFVIFLYDRDKKQGFSMEYYVNISEGNNNYEIFDFIMNRVASMLFLVFVE
ncbi:MAG TPA: hypothetical protein PLU93_03065 [Treponemataceae bacterium]|nr:hypothetical protein [Treponemataceae bacterium]